MKKIFSLSIILFSACDRKTTINTTTPSNPSTISSSSGVTSNGNFFKIKAIVQQRCTTCHATNTSDPSSGSHVAGFALESDAQMKSEARIIKREVVQRRTMPYQNNKTGIT